MMTGTEERAFFMMAYYVKAYGFLVINLTK